MAVYNRTMMVYLMAGKFVETRFTGRYYLIIV